MKPRSAPGWPSGPPKGATVSDQFDQSRQAAGRRLQDAARFARLHATAGPLLNKRQGTGKAAVVVRLIWPGVLVVLDPFTGRELARSEPGQPEKLAADFVPTVAR